MEKKVLNFEGYLKEINEGIRSTNEGIKDVFSKITKFIKSSLNKLIPRGPKKGTPVGIYISHEKGSVFDQVNQLYYGTDFATMNPLKMNESEESYDDFINLDLDEAEKTTSLEDRTKWTGVEGDVRNIKTEELRKELKKLYKSGQIGGRAKPIFIFGVPGIGKTQIVAQAADELGCDMIPLDLQFMSPEDFIGIPSKVDVMEPEFRDGEMISAGKGVTRSNPPSSLPSGKGKSGKGGFIFMDEANRASKRVLNTLNQFVQMGRAGDYQLPKGWVIVAAGNRPSDVAGFAEVADLDFSFADRFKLYNFIPDPKAWAEWAKGSTIRGKHKFPVEIVEFIESSDLFHYLDPEKGNIKFPNPRSWTDGMLELVEELELEGLSDWRDLKMDRIYDIFFDSVGSGAAGKLISYLEVIKDLKDINKITKDIVTNPEYAQRIPKGESFFNIGIVLFDYALKKAEEINGGKASPESIYNILKYYSELGNSELLSMHMARLKEEDSPYRNLFLNQADVKAGSELYNVLMSVETEEDIKKIQDPILKAQFKILKLTNEKVLSELRKKNK
jgi:hypothetical protein